LAFALCYTEDEVNETVKRVRKTLDDVLEDADVRSAVKG
jgi:hypothetical protein